MKNFPLEYIYLDEKGNLYLKRYKHKKIKIDIDTFNIGSIPVVFNKHLTLYTLLQFIFDKDINGIKTNHTLKTVIDKLTKKEIVDSGELYFYWEELQMTNEIPETLYPKMETVIVTSSGKKVNLLDLSKDQLHKINICIDDTFRILNKEGKLIETTNIKPTLFQILYGLICELNLFKRELNA